MVELYTLFQAGKYEEARDLHMRLQRLNTYFEYDPGYVAPCKEALRLLGLPAGPVRALSRNSLIPRGSSSGSPSSSSACCKRSDRNAYFEDYHSSK
jgi:hypothetical protein